jgi:hypothetical protein
MSEVGYSCDTVFGLNDCGEAFAKNAAIIDCGDVAV